MNQNLLDHIDRALKNKPAPIRKESKADVIMKKMFDEPELRVTGEERPATIVESE
jgi:hypothetical protein